MPVSDADILKKMKDLCEQTEDGIYKASWDEFQQATGWTLNILAPLMSNGLVKVSYHADDRHYYHVQIVRSSDEVPA